MLRDITKESLGATTYGAGMHNGKWAVIAKRTDAKGKTTETALMSAPNEELARRAAEAVFRENAPRTKATAKYKPQPRPLNMPDRKQIQAGLLATDIEKAAMFYETEMCLRHYRNGLAYLLDKAEEVFDAFNIPAVHQRTVNAMRAADGLLNCNYDFNVKYDMEDTAEKEAVRGYDILEIIQAIVCYGRTSGGDTGLIAAIKKTINEFQTDEQRKNMREAKARGLQWQVARCMGFVSEEEYQQTMAKAKETE